jgi:methyltransferase
VTAYLLLVVAVGVERLVEVALSERHARWALARGGVEYGRSHYGFMAAMHGALLISCLAEVALADRPFLPWLGWPMLALLLAAFALCWWCINTLGNQWNTRVIVIPGMPLVTTGPYRWLQHPNYVAVAIEVFALPMVHTAWVTAVVFSVANLGLMAVRIPIEERALATVS